MRLVHADALYLITLQRNQINVVILSMHPTTLIRCSAHAHTSRHSTGAHHTLQQHKQIVATATTTTTAAVTTGITQTMKQILTARFTNVTAFLFSFVRKTLFRVLAHSQIVDHLLVHLF